MSYPRTRRSPAATGLRNHNSNYTKLHPITDPFEHLLDAHQRVTGNPVGRSGTKARISCAACGTRSYKVAVARADNGSVLLHAFCGHSPAEVLAALGLTLSDLFQQRDLRTMTPEQRRQLHQQSLITRWHAALNVLRQEATIVLIAANQVADGEAITEEGHTRLAIAALRIFDASEVLNAR